MDKLTLPPGFRFHPTDEELVSHYLRRKVCSRKIDFEAIAEVELYKYEPWDLPDKSILQTRDLEWYFFIPRDKKYANGSRTNRATEKGYWKSTGKDRSISSSSRSMGTKKTLVYYNGRAPKGKRTNWVMHEYRLNETECQKIRCVDNGFVLCRVFHKSGPGPKNGEQYGAPVEDDEFEDSPVQEENESSSFIPGIFEWFGSTSAASGETPASGCENDAVSNGLDLGNRQSSSSEVQLCNLDTYFEGLVGDSQNSSLENHTHSNPGSVFDANGDFVNSAGVTPGSLTPASLEVEGKLMQELYDMVESGVPAVPLKDQDMSAIGTYQLGENLPMDGDFLELADLPPDNKEASDGVTDHGPEVSVGPREYPDDSECSLEEGLPMFGMNSQGQNILVADGLYVGHQLTSEVLQVQSSISNATNKSLCQPSDNIMSGSFSLPSAVYKEELDVAGHTCSEEPEYEDVWKFFDHLSAFNSEDKPFDVENLAENIQRGLLHQGESSTLPLQDGFYYDAMLSFTEVDMSGESTNMLMEASYEDGILQFASQTAEAVDKPNFADSALQSAGSIPENNIVSSEQGSPPRSPLSLLWSCLDSLPTLPASAADLSPRAALPASSTNVKAAGVRLGSSVSVTCTCVGEDALSSCVKCSVAEAGNKEIVVRSSSFRRQIKKFSGRWRMVFFMSAFFVGLWAVFWMLIAGGAWKVLGSVYKLLIASDS